MAENLPAVSSSLNSFLLYIIAAAKFVRETRVSQMHGDDGSMTLAVLSKQRSLSDLRHLPMALYQLIKIPPFMFLMFAEATEGLIASGFATFMPKFIENQFGVTAGWAAMLTGENRPLSIDRPN